MAIYSFFAPLPKFVRKSRGTCLLHRQHSQGKGRKHCHVAILFDIRSVCLSAGLSLEGGGGGGGGVLVKGEKLHAESKDQLQAHVHCNTKIITAPESKLNLC